MPQLLQGGARAQTTCEVGSVCCVAFHMRLSIFLDMKLDGAAVQKYFLIQETKIHIEKTKQKVIENKQENSSLV